MAKIQEYQVFIASPGDVPEERAAAREVCRQLSEDPRIRKGNAAFRAVGWEEAFPASGRPQEIINRLVRDCDLFETAFATIPGALVGTIPPVIGWISGKGFFSFDPQLLAVSFFFFIWQVPHFWLLLLKVGRDYEKAGLPSLTRILTAAQLSRMTFVWIVAAAAACMMIPLFGIVESHTIHGSLFLFAFWLMWRALKLLTPNERNLQLSLTFRAINSYALVVMVLLTLDHLFH